MPIGQVSNSNQSGAMRTTTPILLYALSALLSFLKLRKLDGTAGVVGACIILLLSACGSGTSTGDDQMSLQTLIYSAPRDATLLKDSRLRESVPTQTQGSFGQVKCGDDNGFALDYIAMDSSVVFLDSIPVGSEILACTLWVKLGSMPNNDNDSVVLDLWSVPESWNEDEVSWSSRTAGNPWQSARGGGRIIDTALVRAKRISLFAFEWRINGTLYDTLLLEDGIAVPIPIAPILAQESHAGSSFGFSLRNNSATSNNARISFITIDNFQLVNRPYMIWVYR